MTLVGAGPGNLELLTPHGLRLLRAADVVVHDRLCPREALDEVRPGAEVIDAGKVPGHHAVPQENINELLVEHVRAGRFVVRLKGGDPYLLGRGGEEVEACRAAGVPIEVVAALADDPTAGLPRQSGWTCCEAPG